MEIDTAEVGAIGAELEMVALGWTGAPMAGEPVPALQGACGPSPVGVEVAEGIRTFTLRSQAALGDLAVRVSGAGAALRATSGQFERAEAALAAGAPS